MGEAFMPAANQYGNNFEVQLYAIYGKTAIEVMSDFYAQELTYEEVAKQTGFALPTVRKWCRRYNIKLLGRRYQLSSKKTIFQEMLKKKEINYYNILSKPW